MKKTILAAAALAFCLAPMTAAAADGTSLYGKFKFSVDHWNQDAKAGDNNDGITGNDNTSVVGIKGQYGEGVTAFFHLQTGAKVDQNTITDSNGDTSTGPALTQRFYMGGLKGSLGTLTVGRLGANAYKATTGGLDPFLHLMTTAVNGQAGLGYSYGIANANNGFQDDQIAYTTPSFSGVTATLDLFAGDMDAYTMNVKYNANGVMVALAFAQDSEDNIIRGITADEMAVKLTAAYTAKDQYKVGFSLESIAEEAVGEDGLHAFLSGTYMTPALDYSLTVGMVSGDGVTGEGFGVTGGVFYKVTTNTKLQFIVSQASLENDMDPLTFSLGMQTSFGMGN